MRGYYILVVVGCGVLVFLLSTIIEKCEVLADHRAKLAASGTLSGDEIGRMNSAKAAIDGALTGIYGKRLPKHVTLASVTRDFKARYATTMALGIGVLIGLFMGSRRTVVIVAACCAVALPMMGSGWSLLTFPVFSLGVLGITALGARAQARQNISKVTPATRSAE